MHIAIRGGGAGQGKRDKHQGRQKAAQEGGGHDDATNLEHGFNLPAQPEKFNNEKGLAQRLSNIRGLILPGWSDQSDLGVRSP